MKHGIQRRLKFLVVVCLLIGTCTSFCGCSRLLLALFAAPMKTEHVRQMYYNVYPVCGETEWGVDPVNEYGLYDTQIIEELIQKLESEKFKTLVYESATSSGEEMIFESKEAFFEKMSECVEYTQEINEAQNCRVIYIHIKDVDGAVVNTFGAHIGLTLSNFVAENTYLPNGYDSVYCGHWREISIS